MNKFLLSALLLSLLPKLVGAEAKRNEAKESRPILYISFSSPATDQDRREEKLYGNSFRLLEVSPRDGFEDARLKGEFHGIADPRSMRLWRLPGKVSIAFVVTPEGRVTDLRVLESTDPLFTAAMTEEIMSERYFPARSHGQPVFSLGSLAQKFGHSSRDGNGYGQDGLGIMGYRDR
jgi:hypothetical protein